MTETSIRVCFIKQENSEWNMEHMVKLKTRREVRAVNILEGYREIEICTPQEVIGND